MNPGSSWGQRRAVSSRDLLNLYIYICTAERSYYVSEIMKVENKLKAECLFFICLELLFSLYCNFWHIFRISDNVA